MSSNLKVGVGDPCAEQVKDAGLFLALFSVETSLSDENFGADPPTGSINAKIFYANKTFSHKIKSTVL